MPRTLRNALINDILKSIPAKLGIRACTPDRKSEELVVKVPARVAWLRSDAVARC